jgi:hypothetical protein
MPYVLERGSEGHKFAQGKAIVVNAKTGKHFSKMPIPLANAKKQMRVLQAAESGETAKSQMDAVREIAENE